MPQMDHLPDLHHRHCWACEREVFLVENEVMFEAHARLGHCVAVLDPSRKRKVYALGGPC
jgi:hypothetical protein